jgi:DNA-binding transcriptional LysR family regulator
MTLQQLTYFLAAAEHGSFTAAADVLRLARPSVSEQIAPRIEVQHVTAALELAAGGHGDTLVTGALLDRLGYRDRLHGAPLDPPLHETFAFITRRNVRPSPATRALMTLAERRLAAID